MVGLLLWKFDTEVAVAVVVVLQPLGQSDLVGAGLLLPPDQSDTVLAQVMLVPVLLPCLCDALGGGIG